jgi:hypothetical protein
MYEVDNRDEVQELTGVPQSSIGAPIPVIISDESRVVLGYQIYEDTFQVIAESFSDTQTA